jgi:hypothetical protein
MATLDRAKTLTTPSRRHWLLMAAFVFACLGDDTTPSDGGGSAGMTTTNGTTSTSNGITATSIASASDSGPSSTAAATATDSTGAPPAGACECAGPGPDADADGHDCDAAALAAWVPGCPEAQPCSRLTVACPRPGVDLYDCSQEYTYDEAAMQCVLETLRDGTPARLEIDGTEDYGLFGGQSFYLVHVLEGRMVVRAGCIPGDAGVTLFEPRLKTLPEPEFFTGCMEMATPKDRYDCITLGVNGGDALPECPG